MLSTPTLLVGFSFPVLRFEQHKEQVSKLNEQIGLLRVECLRKDEALAAQQKELEEIVRRRTNDDQVLVAMRNRMAQYEESKTYRQYSPFDF